MLDKFSSSISIIKQFSLLISIHEQIIIRFSNYFKEEIVTEESQKNQSHQIV